MPLLARIGPLLLVGLLLGACSGADTDDSTSTVPAGMTAVITDVGSAARPEAWTPTDGPVADDEVAAFSIEDGGTVVGQMDVIVDRVSAGTEADAVAGALQGARMQYFPDLRHTRREFSEVPGADSAFLTESTYTTADTGDDARSLEQVAVTEDGQYLLIRISSAATAFDPDLFQQVLDTMRVGDEYRS